MSAPVDTTPEILTEPAPDIAAPEPIDPAETPHQERARGFQWGTRSDGQPRRKPGRRPGQKNGTGTTTRTRSAPSANSRQAAPKAAALKPSAGRKRVDYTQPIGTILGALLMPLSFLFPLDAMAVGMRAKDIVDVGNDLGNDVPVIGEFLDKLLKAGPYAAAFSLALSLGIQIGHNHSPKMVPEEAVKLFGGKTRAELIALHQQQQAAARANAAAEQARYDDAMRDAA
jgi:hypothetical protein